MLRRQPRAGMRRPVKVLLAAAAASVGGDLGGDSRLGGDVDAAAGGIDDPTGLERLETGPQRENLCAHRPGEDCAHHMMPGLLGR